MAESYFIVCMYITSYPSSVDGPLGRFHALAVVNSAAVNAGACLFEVFSGHTPGVGRRIHVGTVASFLRNLQTFLHGAAPASVPPTGRRAPSPAPSPALGHVVVR